MECLNTFLSICGGVSIVGGAVAIVWKAINPAVKLGKRVEELEKKSDNDYESIEAIKNAQSLLCQGMIAMIDAQLTGNNVENLKTTKDNMIKYRNIVGSKPSFYKLDDFEAVDVDNPIDFEFAEFLYLKYRV